MWKFLNASALEVNFFAVGEGYWEVGDGCDSEWKYSLFFFAEVGFYSYFIIVTEI